jgi:hypothetical protein
MLIVVALALSLPAWSASLEEAHQLHGEGRTEEALAAIESVLGSGAAGAEKAAALDLLGKIAVDEGQLAMAKQAWTRLVDEYPEYAETHDTATKLSLVSALLKTEAAPPANEIEPRELAEEETIVSPVAPTRVERDAPAAEAPPATVPAAPSPTAPAAEESSGVVLVAARGKPHDAVREFSRRIVEFLREGGVNAESATGGIPVAEDSKLVLPMLLQKGQQDSAGSVVFVTADFASMQKVALDCYTPEGVKLWKMKVSGGTGWKGRPYSVSGITEELAERFLEKLQKKIGEPGLPITLK